MEADDLPRSAPLIRQLRRHHPDVTVVLLPPEDGGGPPDPTSLETARALADEARGALADLGVLLERPFDVSTELWWKVRGAGAHRFVTTAGLRDLDPGNAVELLRVVAAPLLQGPDRARAEDDPHPWVEVLRGRLVVRAEAHHGVLDLTVTTATVLLDGARLAALKPRTS